MATAQERLARAIAAKQATSHNEQQPSTSYYGQKVINQADKERAPVRDVPTNDPTNPDPDAPFDPVLFEQKSREAQGRAGAFDADNQARISSVLAARIAKEGTIEQKQSLLLTSPVEKTGDFALDNRGKPTPVKAGPIGFTAGELASGKKEDFPDEFEFDSEEALKLQRAKEGVDFRKGLPFLKRLNIATTSPIPRARKQRILSTMSEEIRKVPEGIAPIQFDPALQQFYIATQVSEQDIAEGFEKAGSLGKFRYTSLDGAGIEMADIADLMNLGEIGSIAGSVAGAGKGKVLNFGKANSAIGGAGGGAAGRLTGDALSVFLDMATSGWEFVPTREELADLGMDDVQTEVLASLIGEAAMIGAKSGSSLGQDIYARMTGREGVKGTGVDVANANLNIFHTKQDLARVKTVTGSEDLVVTKGQSAGSIELVELENSRLKNAKPATKRFIESSRAKSDRATEQFVERVFGGDLRVWNGRHGVITRANAAISNGEQLVTSTADGMLGIHPRVSPEHGLKIRPQGDGTWQVKGALLPENLQGIGMGGDLYRTAVEEARAHGAILKSDDNVTEAAARIWRSMDGEEKVGKLKWNPTAEFNETLKRWETTDGLPVVQMAERDPFLPKLIAEFMTPGQGKGGKLVANKEFARFLRRPGRGELGAVVAEIEENQVLRHDLKEAIFDDYQRNVQKADGSFSVNAFETWKEETGGMLERVFTPEEMLAVRKRGGLRRVLESSRETAGSLDKSLRQVVQLDNKLGLRDPAAGSTIYKQLKNMSSGKMRRTVALLEEGDMLGQVQELFKEDLRQILQPKVAGRTASRPAAQRLSDFIKNNENLIRNMFPDKPNMAQQYVADLRTVARMQERKALRTTVAGSREEANPSALAFTRVAFGPLSRAQRFLTAGQRFITRSMGESAVDMVNDPQKLRYFMQIKDLPMGSKQVTQALPRLYGAEFFESINVNPEDPAEMEAWIAEVNKIRMAIDQAAEDE